jgi:hypothetical protein
MGGGGEHSGHSDMGGSVPKGSGPMEGGGLSLLDMMSTLSGQKPMDPNGFGFIKRLSSGVCKDCTILAGTMRVVSESGKILGVSDGIYIHHAVTMDVSKSVKSYITGCGDVAGMLSAFVGAGVDDFTQHYTTPDGKFPSGYYVKDDTFLMQVELVNYNDKPQKVFINMELDYVPGKVGGDATQAFLSATSKAPD